MHRTRLFPRRHDAFTLIELLVVIVIIGILVGISVPVYNQLIIKSRQTQTLSNMRQVGAAFLLYAADNNYQLPGRVTQGDRWPKLLSTYVGNLNVYNSPIPDYAGKQVTDPTLLLNNLTPNHTDYMLNGYNDIGGYTNSSIAPRLNSIPTPTQVILLGIKTQTAGDYYMDIDPAENNEINELETTAWPNGSIYVFCDGSSRFLKYPPPGANPRPNLTKPTTSDYYTDWLWLINKSNGVSP